MKKSLFIIAFMFVFAQFSVAQEGPVDKMHEVAHETVEGTKNVAHTIGKGVKNGAHKVATVAKKAKNHVVSSYRNSKHAIQRSGAGNGANRANKSS